MKPESGWSKTDSGQQSRNPCSRAKIQAAEARIQRPIPITNPLKDPFEEPLRNPLKNSGEAGTLQKHSVDELILISHDVNEAYAAFGQEKWEAGKITSFHSGPVLVQDQSQSLQGFLNELRDRHDSIISLDEISRFTAEGVFVQTSGCDYSWHEVLAAVPLHAFRENVLPATDSWRFTRIVRGFVEGRHCEVIRRLIELHDPNQTLAVLGEQFLDHLSKSDAVIGGVSREDLYFAGLELLVYGIQSAHDLLPIHDAKSGLNAQQIESVCNAALETSARSERHRFEVMTGLATERYEKYKEEFASSTRDEECNDQLPPGIKAKIFCNAVREIQGAGIHVVKPAVDQAGNIVAVASKYKKAVVNTKEDERRAQEFFESHNGVCARSLLDVFHGCVRVYTENSAGHGFAEKGFYAERAVNVPFFFRYLEKIAKELKNRYAVDYPKRIDLDQNFPFS